MFATVSPRLAALGLAATSLGVALPACSQQKAARPTAIETAAVSGAAASTAQPAAGQDKWLSYNAATKTVTFQLIGGPFNYNGYAGGDASLVVPPGSKVVMPFVNEDGTPHSAEIIEDKNPMPNMAADPAIPQAETSKVMEGLPQGAKDTIQFTAPGSGSYRIFCGVPGHGL